MGIAGNHCFADVRWNTKIQSGSTFRIDLSRTPERLILTIFDPRMVMTASVHPTRHFPAETKAPCSDMIDQSPTTQAKAAIDAGSVGSAGSCTTNPWAIRATDSLRERSGNRFPTIGDAPFAACRNPNSIRCWTRSSSPSPKGRPRPSLVPRAAPPNPRYRHRGPQPCRSRAIVFRWGSRPIRSTPPRSPNPGPGFARTK